MALNEPGAPRGEFRCGRLVPNEPAEVLEVARLRFAKLIAPPDELLAASRSVDPWELKLLM